MLARCVARCPCQNGLTGNLQQFTGKNSFSTSALSQSRLQRFKDRFLFEKDHHKRPSDLEIAQKGLPRNTPTLLERVKRDSNSPLYVADRKGGYHKGLSGTYADYFDPNQTTMEIVKEATKGWVTELTKLGVEVRTLLSKGFHYGFNDLPKPGEERLAFDFEDPAVLDDWICSCDSTWGEGYSTATLTESPNAKGKALFSGVIDTRPPNDGRIKWAGYAGIRSVHKLKSFGRVDKLNWDLFSHLILRVRGDGRTYLVNLHYYEEMDILWNDIHQFPLFTRGGPYWQTVVIPFKSFYLTHMGRIQDHMDWARPEDVVSVGISLMDDVDGPFHLEIDSIKVRMAANKDSARSILTTTENWEEKARPYETYKMPRKNYNSP